MEEMNLPRVRDAALSFAVDGYPTTYLSDDDLHAARRGWGDGRLNPKGVSFRHSRSKSKPWEASISFMGKNRGLGSYATPDQAARAYDCAARIAYAGLPLESLREKLNFPDHLVYPPEACRKGLSKIQEDLMGAEEAAVVLQDISCVAPAPDPAAATPRARQTGARSAANGAAGKHADGAGGAGAAPGADDGDALPDPEDAAAFEETLEAFLALRCGPERDEEAANAAEDGPPGACATAKAQAERAGPASARPGSRGEGATAGPEGEAEGAAEAQEAAQDPEQEPEQDEVPSHGFLGVPEWLEEHQLATTDEGFLAWEMEMPHSNISGRGRSAGEDARQAQRIDARLDELEREAELAADNPDPDAPYVPRWGDGGAAAQQQHAGTAGRVWKGLYHRPSKNRPWEASISFLGRNRGLGSYVSPEEGARAFDAAARLILQGLPPEDMGARLNYPHREFPAPERAVAGIERIRADMDAEGISVRDAHLYAVRGKAGMRRPQGAAPAPEDEEDGEEEAEREAERLPARPRKPGEWGGSGKRRAYAPLPARMGQGFWAEEAMRGYPAEGSASEGSDGEEPSDRAVARWGECCLPEDSWGSILANDAGFREVTSAPQASGAAALGGVQLRAPPGPLAPPPPPLPLPPPVRPPPPAPGPSGLAPLVLPPGTLVGNRYHTYCMVCHEKGGDGLVCENDLDLCPCTVCWGCLGIDSLEANFIDFFYCPSCVDRRGLQGRHRDDASTLPYDLERLRVAWMRAKEEHDLLQKQHAAETGGVAQVWGAPLPTAFAIAPSGCADAGAPPPARSTGAAKSERARGEKRARSAGAARARAGAKDAAAGDASRPGTPVAPRALTARQARKRAAEAEVAGEAQRAAAIEEGVATSAQVRPAQADNAARRRPAKRARGAQKAEARAQPAQDDEEPLLALFIEPDGSLVVELHVVPAGPPGSSNAATEDNAGHAKQPEPTIAQRRGRRGVKRPAEAPAGPGAEAASKAAPHARPAVTIPATSIDGIGPATGASEAFRGALASDAGAGADERGDVLRAAPKAQRRNGKAPAVEAASVRTRARPRRGADPEPSREEGSEGGARAEGDDAAPRCERRWAGGKSRCKNPAVAGSSFCGKHFREAESTEQDDAEPAGGGGSKADSPGDVPAANGLRRPEASVAGDNMDVDAEADAKPQPPPSHPPAGKLNTAAAPPLPALLPLFAPPALPLFAPAPKPSAAPGNTPAVDARPPPPPISLDDEEPAFKPPPAPHVELPPPPPCTFSPIKFAPTAPEPQDA